MVFMPERTPAINSLLSAYMALERPVMWGELKAIQQRLGGRANFPLVDQNCHTSFREMQISPDPPCVVKIGHAHAGQGKILVHDRTQWDDVKSIVALHGDYTTAEPYVPADFDARIQKIGPHYRAFKRVSANWKMNQGHGSVVEEIPVPPEWQRWSDECATACGGLDILGLDLIHDKVNDRYFILELNDTAIGLVHKVAEEDNAQIRDLVLFRMTQYFNPASEDVTSIPAAVSFSSEGAPSSSAFQPMMSTTECPNCRMNRFQLEAFHRRLHEIEIEKQGLEDRDPPHTARMLALSGFVGAVLASVSIFAVSIFRSWKA